jgi:hypothetical protein
MKLERRKFLYQGYYNSIQGHLVPCDCVLEYVEPIEVEALEKRIEELEEQVLRMRHCANCKNSDGWNGCTRGLEIQCLSEYVHWEEKRDDSTI